MKKIHVVQSYGYHNCPEFATLGEAQACLQILKKESLAGAKRVSKQARLHKIGEDNYTVTLGADKRSTLWAAFFINSI